MIDLQELSKVSHEIAESKGWWDKPRTFAGLTLLMQSEISEALEDYRNGRGLTETWYEHKLEGGTTLIDQQPAGASGALGKFCGIPSEIADVVIRICDFAGHYGLTLKPVTVLEPSTNFETALALSSLQISRAFDVLHTDGLEAPGHYSIVSICLSLAARHLEIMCEANGIDLDKAIQIKMEFNRTRPMRHGGKLI